MKAESLYLLVSGLFPPVISMEGSFGGDDPDTVFVPELVKAYVTAEEKMENEHGVDSIETLSVWAYFGILHRIARSKFQANETQFVSTVSLLDFKKELEECLKVEGCEDVFEQYRKTNNEDR